MWARIVSFVQSMIISGGMVKLNVIDSLVGDVRLIQVRGSSLQERG